MTTGSHNRRSNEAWSDRERIVAPDRVAVSSVAGAGVGGQAVLASEQAGANGLGVRLHDLRHLAGTLTAQGRRHPARTSTPAPLRAAAHAGGQTEARPSMGSSPTRARGEQVPGRSRWSAGSGSACLCRPSAGERAREPCEVVVDVGEWKWGLAHSLERAVDPGERGALIAHPLENGTGSHGRRQRRDEARFLHSRPQRVFASLVEQMVGPEAVAWEAAAPPSAT